MTAADVRAAWLSQFTTNTRDGYARDVDQYLAWLGSDPFPGDRARIQSWLGYLAGLGRSPATINRKASAVASFYQYALEEGHITRNPAELIKRPRVSDGQKMGLDIGQAQALIAEAARDKTATALVWLMVGCALRVTEACSLNTDDIDLSSTPPVLRVQTKGGKIQTKPIPPPAVSAIVAVAADRPPSPLLINHSGKRLTRHRAWEILEKLTGRAGIENCTPHTLRHTAASLALASGVPIQDVQKLLGHRSIETTLRYVRNLDNLTAANNAASSIGEVLTRKEPAHGQ